MKFLLLFIPAYGLVRSADNIHATTAAIAIAIAIVSTIATIVVFIIIATATATATATKDIIATVTRIAVIASKRCPV